MEQFTKFIEALSHLVGVIVWPSVALLLAWWFGPAIRSLLADFSEGSVKGFGIEASAKKVAAVASLAAAQESRATGTKVESPDTEVISENSADALTQSAELITSSVIKKSKSKLILWVDDQPEGNLNERKALRAIGYKIWKASSTEKALEFLNEGNNVDIIISDLRRPEGERAGFDLLGLCKRRFPNTPFIIYAGLFKKDLRDEAVSLGAAGFTSDPTRLIRLVIESSS